MLFSLNEDGDLNIREGKYFSDFVMSNKIESDYRLTKTLLLTHLVFKKWFEKDFLLYKRLTKSDMEIKKIINDKLNEIFKEYPYLLTNINFSFIINKDILNIVFYLNNPSKRMLFDKEIKIG